MNEQINFWVNTYAESYIQKNSIFNKKLSIDSWNKMLSKTQDIKSLLECGSNIGRNINVLNEILPKCLKSIIEVSPKAFLEVTEKYDLDFAFNGPILNAETEKTFDLVFTIAVLIHIHPNELLENLKKIYQLSNKYILIGEYFNRTPVSIEYHGEKDKLFKCDFGKLWMENFDVVLIDYGFLWGHIYDSAGFDDITWWLFQKNEANK